MKHAADTIMTDFQGIHLGQLWRLQISSESMACVIAQRRVQPIVFNGNPLTEHNQLFVQAYVCADQQVPVFDKTEWKSRLQPQRSEGKTLVLRTLILQDALTYVTCTR